jgi:hypothetical protein
VTVTHLDCEWADERCSLEFVDLASADVLDLIVKLVLRAITSKGKQITSSSMSPNVAELSFEFIQFGVAHFRDSWYDCCQLFLVWVGRWRFSDFDIISIEIAKGMIHWISSQLAFIDMNTIAQMTLQTTCKA